MGEVFEAEHVLLGNRAAVKLLHPDMCVRPENTTRFFTEARAAASVRHPGLVEVLDFGYHTSGNAYLVMELLEGESLASALARQGRLAPTVAVTLARQVASAMAAAHRFGIVHRDLKPDNLYLVADSDFPGGWRVKVLDFGVAKLASASLTGVSTTRTGQLIGTPLYMAPEQCHGASHVDARADIYSLGCIIYHMLCGRPPFVSEGVGPVIAAHLYEIPLRPQTLVSDVPPRVDALVMRLLEKAPDDRPATMAEVEQFLAASVSGAVDLPMVDLAMGSGPNPRDPVRADAVDASGTAWESAPSPRRVRAPWAVLAAIACGGLLLAATIAWKRPSVRPTVSAATPSVAAPAPAVAAAPQLAPPSRVSLRIDSRPAEAEVVRVADGVVLGRTPLVLDLPAGHDAVSFRPRNADTIPRMSTFCRSTMVARRWCWRAAAPTCRSRRRLPHRRPPADPSPESR
jgi:serine/threonine-protein kinase